jgi:hypothetical protein
LRVIEYHPGTGDRVGTQSFFRDQHTGTGKQSHFEQIAPLETGGNQLAAIVRSSLPFFLFSSIPFGDIRHLELLLLHLALSAGQARF